MKRFRFSVPRYDAYAADVSLELYGDLGRGTIDYDRPLPPGRTRLWLDAPPRAGHLHDAHLIAGHLDSVRADGHLEGAHLWHAHLWPVLLVTAESPRYVFGRFRHAIRFFDGAGNPTAGDPVEYDHIVNDSPPVPRGLRRVGWDGQTQRIRFALEPVRFKPVAGS
jgi:hypothetical protein